MKKLYTCGYTKEIEDRIKKGELVFIVSGFNSNGVFCEHMFTIPETEVYNKYSSIDGLIIKEFLSKAEMYLHKHGVKEKQITIIDFKNYVYECFGFSEYKEKFATINALQVLK